MKISIIVSLNNKPGETLPSYEELFQSLSNVGFQAADVNLADGLNNLNTPDSELAGDWQDNILKYKKAAVNSGIELYQSHLPFHGYSVDVDKIAQADMEEFSKQMFLAMDASKELGIKWAIVHPRRKESIEESIKATQKYMKDYLAYARNIGLKIAVENVFYMTAEEILAIAQSLGEDVGICWDTGHANLAKANQYDSICLLGSKVKAVHLHDNNSEEDEHRLFFMGNIEWNDVCRALKDIKFKGTFNLEILHSNIPKELHNDWNRLLVSNAQFLMKSICE